MIMKILVTGGNGYIGSHMVDLLLENNHQVVVIDLVDNTNPPMNVTYCKANIGNQAVVNEVLKKEKIDAVIHFAGSIEVGESIINPGKYYKNNICNGINFLNCLVENDI